MTPEKAIKIAIHCLGVQAEHEVCEECPVYLDGGIACREAARVAIEALKEIQQYREIGTVKECREAMEKQKPKKILPLTNGLLFDDGWRHKCPNCGCAVGENIYHPDVTKDYEYCSMCGQAIHE